MFARGEWPKGIERVIARINASPPEQKRAAIAARAEVNMRETIKEVPTMLNGYKTYIAAVLLALVGIVEGILGIDVPGVDVTDDWFTVLITALGLGGVRHAISKVERKQDEKAA